MVISPSYLYVYQRVYITTLFPFEKWVGCLWWLRPNWRARRVPSPCPSRGDARRHWPLDSWPAIGRWVFSGFERGVFMIVWYNMNGILWWYTHNHWKSLNIIENHNHWKSWWWWWWWWWGRRRRRRWWSKLMMNYSCFIHKYSYLLI